MQADQTEASMKFQQDQIQIGGQNQNMSTVAYLRTSVA